VTSGPVKADDHQPMHVAPAASSADELLRAFQAGTGVKQLQLPKGLTPEVMNLVGQLLRESIQGTLELLVARAVTKREIRARDITILVARENNPLKHSVTLEAALNTLLSSQPQGFMPPAAAMRDAYRDLRSHQFGVMAGMRAALTGVLERFDPARLERRLAQRGAIDALMPGGRRARLWEMFEQLYAEISKEAEDDFEMLFGRAFLKAYEAQIAKLKQEDVQD
jgi:FHA domain-containing protein